VEEMVPWLHEHEKDKFPILAAKVNDRIVGWSDIKPYRKSRSAFDSVVEVSYFINNDFQRKGIGDLLLKEIQNIAKNIGYKTMIAILMGINTGSIKLLEKNGFKLWGNMPGIINIDGRMIDHLYYGKHL
jgi:phosphinothricin acetyltransferase